MRLCLVVPQHFQSRVDLIHSSRPFACQPLNGYLFSYQCCFTQCHGICHYCNRCSKCWFVFIHGKCSVYPPTRKWNDCVCFHLSGISPNFIGWGHLVGGGQFDPHHAASSAAVALEAGCNYVALCNIGIIATVYHFANGLWSHGYYMGPLDKSGCDAESKLAQPSSSVIGLGAAGLGALGGMRSIDVSKKQKKIETRMYKARQILDVSRAVKSQQPC